MAGPLVVAGAGLLMALGGCGGGTPPPDPDPRASAETGLESACLMVPCDCRPDGAWFVTSKTTKPIVWSPDGRAACPSGYRLTRQD